MELTKSRTKSMRLFSKETAVAMRLSSIFLPLNEVEDLVQREGWDVKPHSKDVDCYTVFCCMNTWCCLFQDITGKTGEILATQVRLNGISYAINTADAYRLTLLNEEPNKNSFWYSFVREVSEENLTLLGFPRRMRITGKEDKTSFEKFRAGNIKCSHHNDVCGGPILYGNDTFRYNYESCSSHLDRVEWLKYHTYTPGFVLDEARRLWTIIFSDWKQDVSLFQLPPGVTYEGAHTYVEKWRIVLEQQIWLREKGVNIPILPTARFSEPSNCCRYNLVPKTFKSQRGIAPEPVAKQVLGYQIDSGIRKCLKSFGVDLSDQSKNQEMSADLNRATEDISAASDSISRFLVSYISADTPELREKLLSIRSSFVEAYGRKFVNHRFATMGNACTFSVEAAIFLIIGIITHELHCNMRFKNGKTLRWWCKNNIAIYGDDCIIPVAEHELFSLVCEWFGFTVNAEKSYGDWTGYRESCGAEWYHGLNVTGTYWPRGLSKIPLAELVSMQHKLYCYPTANAFLVCVILDVFPDTTQSEIGSPYQDIWCENPNILYSGHSPYVEHYHVLQHLVRCKKVSGKSVYRLSEEKKDTYVKSFAIFSTVPNWFKDRCNLHFPKWSEIWLPVDCPHEDNYEVHTTITAVSTGQISPEQKVEVDHLAYLLTIGNGIEHVNGSPYTKDEDMIMNRRDLVAKRKIKIQNKTYPM